MYSILYCYTAVKKQMTSEKRAQKFNTDDVSLPRSGWCFCLVESNFPHDTTNQKHRPDLGIISREFLRLFLRRHLAGKPVVAMRNVGCFLCLTVAECYGIRGLYNDWLRNCLADTGSKLLNTISPILKTNE